MSESETILIVDDAHGFGTLGKTGAGAGEEQGVQDDIDVYFATFAKSMAGIGAFLAADKEIIDYLKYNLRSQMFAKSLPMIYVKGALKRLDMLRTKPELREKLSAVYADVAQNFEAPSQAQLENINLLMERFSKAKADFEKIKSKRLSKFEKYLQKNEMKPISFDSREDFIENF